MTQRIAAAAVAALVVGSMGGWIAAADDAPVTNPQAPFDRRMIDAGRSLALIGNCNSCHTVERGATFAGGRALKTPFGTLYSTNITPDVDTGIGRWTAADFRRAMGQGVAPGGKELYPAFPYDHFARVERADVDAIYAYLMTRQPVHAVTPPNELRPPYNLRPLLVFWKALYFHPQAIVPDPAKSAEWNRGRYLVDGLAHCGACHTPRNAQGAEERGHDLEGGEAEGWHAPALAETSRAPTRWTADALVAYLQDRFVEDHGTSRGPMAPVSHNLARVPDADVRAIAVYIASRAGQSNVGPSLAVTREQLAALPARAADGTDPAAILYTGACADCHDRTQRGVHLEYSTAVTDSAPSNIARVVTDGLGPVEGRPIRTMPGFRGALTAAQTAAVIRHVRARYSVAPPWPDVEREVDKARGDRPPEGNS